MIILSSSPDPEPERATVPSPRAAQPQCTLKVLIYGFSPAERELIQGIVALSQRRSLRLELARSETAGTADVVLIDGTDKKVMSWAAKASMLAGKTVVQVDGPNPLPGATYLPRPIQWPKLPSLLMQTLDPNSPLLSTRQPLSVC